MKQHMIVGKHYVTRLPFMCVAGSRVVQARVHVFKKLGLFSAGNSLNIQLHRIQIPHRLGETHSLVTAYRMTTNHWRTKLAAVMNDLLSRVSDGYALPQFLSFRRRGCQQKTGVAEKSFA